MTVATLDIEELTNRGGNPVEVGSLPVVNPARVIKGEEVVYDVTVSDPSKLADSDIVWKQEEGGGGKVSVADDRGRKVKVLGETPGSFKLKVSVLETDPNTGTSNLIPGDHTLEAVKVMEQKRMVNVRAVIMKDEDGNQASTPDLVQMDIDTANLIWQQCGVEFKLVGGVTRDETPGNANSQFFKIESRSALDRLFNLQIGTNAIEVYYVRKIVDINPRKPGISTGVMLPTGVAINGEDSNRRTLAHELGHAIGLDHKPNSVSLMFKKGVANKADIQASECAIVEKSNVSSSE